MPAPVTKNVQDIGLISPFSDVIITDDSADLSVTIQLSNPGNGVLTNLGAGGYNAATGSYMVTGTAAEVQAAIRALQFDPTDRPNAQVGAVQETTFTISVNDGAATATNNNIKVSALASDRAPSAVTLTSTTVQELAATGTVVGTLGAADSNAGDTFTYELVGDTGGRFKIVGNQLIVDNGVKLDYEQAVKHDVKIRVKDSGGLTHDTNFSIGVLDVATEVTAGSSDNDLIKGGKGNDKIGGGGLNDTLFGGLGKDTLTGNTGKDFFVFDSKLGKTNVDKITDFKVVDDTIWLDDAVFKNLGKGTVLKPGKLKKDFFAIADKAQDATDHILYDKAKGVLFYDDDGTGRHAAVQVATLKKNFKITEKDFFVI